MTKLTSDAVTNLVAGASYEDEFDIALNNDLSEGGTVTIYSEGYVNLVTNGSVSGTMPYSSNELTIDIDPKQAKTVSKARPMGKARTITTCSPDRQAIVDTVLANTVKLANAAADAATSGDAAQFNYYFKTTASEARERVSARLRGVAREAGSTSDNINYYCTDPWPEQGNCKENFLAYAWAQYSMIANCELYYTLLTTELPTVCEGQDEATTAVHEFTHLPAVYNPPTSDFKYSDEALLLGSEQALENADNYAMYVTGELPFSLADF